MTGAMTMIHRAEPEIGFRSEDACYAVEFVQNGRWQVTNMAWRHGPATLLARRKRRDGATDVYLQRRFVAWLEKRK